MVECGSKWLALWGKYSTLCLWIYIPDTSLTTLIVCTIINSRPIVPVCSDPESAMILSPNMLLTQKTGEISTNFGLRNIKDMYKAQWRCGQHLANIIWGRWKKKYFQTFQSRTKWQFVIPDLCIYDTVLLKHMTTARIEWSIGIITIAITSVNGTVDKVESKSIKRNLSYTEFPQYQTFFFLMHNDGKHSHCRTAVYCIAL